MITVTEAARSRLSQKLADHPAQVAARLVCRDGHARIRPSHQRSGDKVFDFGGRTVLLLDNQISSRFTNCTLDVRTTGEGQRLRLFRTS